MRKFWIYISAFVIIIMLYLFILHIRHQNTVYVRSRDSSNRVTAQVMREVHKELQREHLLIVPEEQLARLDDIEPTSSTEFLEDTEQDDGQSGIEQNILKDDTLFGRDIANNGL